MPLDRIGFLNILSVNAGKAAQYKGTVETVKGYQGRPEVNVTHHRKRVSEGWTPVQPMILKGDDFILQEIVNPLVAESGIEIRKLESDTIKPPPEDRKPISPTE